MIEFDCTCVQKHHSIPTEVIEVSDHAILKVPEILKDYHRIFLVADENTYEVAGKEVEALLKEADCSYDDVMEIIVYLRDVADYDVVQALFKERFPDKPYVIVHAAVCRPGWLVEMECMAVKKIVNSDFPVF